MSHKPFAPMLACDADLAKLKYPLLASEKLDGVRAVVRDGVVYSRSNKPIPNKAVQQKFGHLWFCDGELIVGEPTSKSCYRDTVSVVMSHDKPATDVWFFMFDHVENQQEPYGVRAKKLDESTVGAIIHEQVVIEDEVMLLCMEADALYEGHEGLILRDPNAPYKKGRSTVNEGYLLKLKTFMDAEAVIVGFEERMHNGNEATVSELGRTKRSSHKAGKTGRSDLGALIVRTPQGVEFNIGTGFTDEERYHIWKNKTDHVGKLVKYKYFPVGVKDKPRHPVYLGMRSTLDL